MDLLTDQPSDQQDTLSAIFAPKDPNEEDYLKAIAWKKMGGDMAINQARRDIANKEATLNILGEQPPPEEGPSFLYKLTDTLDTPGQAVRGLLASQLGYKDYAGLHAWDAMKKGMASDLTVGEILRDNSQFRDHNILRGVAGFVGDMATDPLSYLTFGSQAARLGGLPVTSEKFLSTVGGAAEMLSPLEIKSARLAKLATDENLLAKYGHLKDISTPEAWKEISARFVTESEQEAAQPFRDLRAFFERKRELTRAGIGPGDMVDTGMGRAADIYDLTGVEGMKKQALMDLGLAEDTDAKALFETSAIRFHPWWGGFESAWTGRISPFNATDHDIPGITDLSKHVINAIDEGYFGAAVKTRRWIDQGLLQKDSPWYPAFKMLDGAGEALNSTGRLATKLLAPFSRRIEASGSVFGSRAKLETILDAERARDALVHKTWVDTAIIGRHFMADMPEDVTDDLLKSITHTMQDGIRAGRAREGAETEQFLAKTMNGATFSQWDPSIPPGGVAKNARDIVEDENAFNAGLEKLRANYNQIGQQYGKKALGDDAANMLLFIRDDMKRMGDDLQQKGLLSNAIQGFVHQMHRVEPGMDEEFAKSALNRTYFKQGVDNVSSSDFSLPRVFRNLEEAKNYGFIPNENALDIYFNYKLQYNAVNAHQDFAHRLAYQWALNGPAYDAIRFEAANASSDIQRQALRAMRQLGLPDAYSEIPYLAKSAKTGMTMTPDYYERLLTVQPGEFTPQGLALRDARANAMLSREEGGWGLKFPNPSTAKTPEEAAALTAELERERGLVKQWYDGFQGSRSIRLGREGEDTFTRAGGVRLKDLFPDRQWKFASEEDKAFWDNLVPLPLAQAVNESADGLGLVSDLARRAQATKAGEPFSTALHWMARVGTGFTRLLKAGATQWWPAYWLRNVESAQFMGAAAVPIGGAILGPGVQAAKALGEHLNIFSLTRNAKILNDGVVGYDVLGKMLTREQLLADMGRYGIKHSAASHADLAATYVDEIMQRTDFQRMISRNPQLESMLGESDKGLLGTVSSPFKLFPAMGKWIKDKTGMGLSDPFWAKFQSLPDRMENYGREHLFTSLRLRGYDAQSAADLTNKLMIDYTHGKTSVERKLLNNIFFFYSFSRGQATNNFMTLMEKPGAITAQLHTRDAIAEMLTDPNNYVEGQAEDASAQTARSKEQLSKYIGVNPKTGLPLILSQVGMPIEDTARFAGITLPKRLTWNDFVNSAGDSGTRTAHLMLSNANPIMNAINQAFVSKQNYFFDRPIDDPTIRKIPLWSKDMNVIWAHPFNAMPKEVWKGLDKATSEVLGGVDNGDGTMTINPYMMVVLSNLVPGASRFFNTKQALSKPGVSSSAKYLRFLSGVEYQEVDAEKSLLMDRKKQIDNYFTNLALPQTKRQLAWTMMQKAKEQQGEE